jgi:hypothetical protein
VRAPCGGSCSGRRSSGSGSSSAGGSGGSSSVGGSGDSSGSSSSGSSSNGGSSGSSSSSSSSKGSVSGSKVACNEDFSDPICALCKSGGDLVSECPLLTLTPYSSCALLVCTGYFPLSLHCSLTLSLTAWLNYYIHIHYSTLFFQFVIHTTT